MFPAPPWLSHHLLSLRRGNPTASSLTPTLGFEDTEARKPVSGDARLGSAVHACPRHTRDSYKSQRVALFGITTALNSSG